MAKKHHDLVDDLDGTTSEEELETVHFGLDGVIYLIDLNGHNASRLRAALRDFIVKARRIGDRRTPGPGHAKAERAHSGRQTRAIREWARRNGHAISDRGRIPDRVVTAFLEQHR